MRQTVPRILQGFRDHFGPLMERRNEVLGKIKAVLRSYGFQPLETPALEYQDIVAPHADQSDKLIYSFTDHGERKVAMKYDLTVPTARFAAMNWDKLPKPFRRYQNQPVWRADRPGAGRYREFQQFDFDTYGSASVLYDAEILLVIEDCLRTVNLGPFTIRVNDRRLLTGLLDAAGIEAERQTAALRSLDKLEKVAAEGVQTEMVAAKFDPDTVARLLEFLVELDGLTNEDLLVRLDEHFRVTGSLIGQEGTAALRTILNVVGAAGLPQNIIRFKPVLARGLDYYTGPIHEVVAHDAAVGSVCGGGRYDDLFGKFSDQSVPATGTSLGIERILDVLVGSGDKEMAPATEVLICATDQPGMIAGLILATKIRALGRSVEVYLADSPLRKQLRYADLKQIPLVVLMPRSEDEPGSRLALKEMKTGRQELIEQACLPEYVAEVLHRELGGTK